VNWEDYYRDDTQLNLPEVTWADYDQQRRLIIAKDGKLFTVTVEPGKGEQSLTFTELADFNANEPSGVETPTWAKKW
jgi:hypothetical protein